MEIIMDNKIRVTLESSDVAEYYELAEIFHSSDICVEIVTQKANGAEMGVSFSELVVLLPLVVPFIVQFRKILVAYFKYKKTLKKKTSITLECNGKKLKIESENESMPSVEQFMAFFTTEKLDISEDSNCE